MNTEHPVILFDGVCNLCNGAINWVIRHDKKHRFRFAALQSTFAKQVLDNHLPLHTATTPDSIILLEKGIVFTRSAAVLKIARQLDGIWPLFYTFIIVPPFIRDYFYNFIARNRYKWFGRKEDCLLPDWPLKNLFYD
ncbi:MAG: DUF393 domain-containing protein [Sphingobacteriia bacterium]|nr:DUF393 domain-containing protein [Sphingobacteriia bacterium]